MFDTDSEKFLLFINVMSPKMVIFHRICTYIFESRLNTGFSFREPAKHIPRIHVNLFPCLRLEGGKNEKTSIILCTPLLAQL